MEMSSAAYASLARAPETFRPTSIRPGYSPKDGEVLAEGAGLKVAS